MSGKQIHILIVEDSRDDAELLIHELRRGGFDPVAVRVDTLHGLARELAAGPRDIVFADFNLPGFDALNALREVQAAGKDIPFIVVSGSVGEESAVGAMKAGAHDFFLKDRLTRLSSAVEREMREARIRAEHREASARILESEERFRNIADSAPVMIWGSGRDTQCDYFNQPWLTFRGRTMAEEERTGWTEGVHPDDLDGCMNAYLGAFEAREAFRSEYRLRRHDGEFRWILNHGIPRRTPDGVFLGYLGSCVDVTEQKQTEWELKKSVQTRDEFLSIVSHELRTPLTSLDLQLGSAVRLLRNSVETQTAKLERKLAAALKHSSRINVLIDSLLDVTRIVSGRLQLACESVDLRRLVASALGDLEEMSAGREIHFDDGPPVIGLWDPLRLEVVVVNLLANALKYGQGKPIEVTVAVDEHVARLTVADRGIGIPPEDAERIFDRFWRSVSVNQYGGFGIGLWVARQVVNLHGGTIRASSRPGGGSIFLVELPLTPPEPAPRDDAGETDRALR